MKNHEFHFEIEENDKAFKATQKKHNLKEYIFMTKSGYRHFFVLGNDLKEAEENFMRIDILKRCGFTLDDLPVRLEYDEEKAKNLKMTDFWATNENKQLITNS